MDQRITRNASRLSRGRGSTRNVGNLHVINTSIQAPITNPPEYIRTVTMTPKRNVQNTGTRPFAVQKGAAMSFTKKKINAAKNFLQQHNKESPVKKAINSKVNSPDNYSKPSLSSNDSSSNLANNSPLPNTTNSMASSSPNGSLTSTPSSYSKSTKHKPVGISHQSHSCLALYEVDMSLKARSINTTQTTPCKEKREVVSQKVDSGSSWVPIDMKKANTTKELPVYNKSRISDKDKNSPSSRNIESNQNRPVFDTSIPIEKKKPMKEIPSKMFVDSKGEGTLNTRYSDSSRHFSSRQEEQYYEKIYGLSRSSKIKRPRYYERERKRQYKESYPYYFSRKSRKARKYFHEDFETLEDVSDVPLDEDFEEVETASMEDASKPSEIPVGFRKYHKTYLAAKTIGFFKPKIYHICQDRTVVSCLNMEAESVDVVSEAECETDHTATEKKAKDDKLNADDNKLETSSENVQTAVLKTIDGSLKMEHIPKITNEKLEEKCEPSKHAPDSNKDLLVPTDDINNSTAMDTNVIDTAIIMPSIKEKQEVISSSKFYYTCIPESDSPNFYQGHSLFQRHLDEWESHLIGLEYIVEVRSTDRTQAKKYNCGLCMEELTRANIDGQIVINHVSSYKHASAYMAKHFPSCGYKFSKNESRSNVLQRCCKEINHKLSYYFLCVTTDDYFQKLGKEVNELLNSLPHWTETDIDINMYVNDAELCIDKDVSQLMKDMIHKIAPGEEIATFISSRNESAQELHRKKARNSILEKDSSSIDNSVTSGNLIVLTPQHSNILNPVPKCIQPVPKCLPSISKCSNDIRPNLLRVITHEETDSSIGNSSKIVGQTTNLSDQSAKDVHEKNVSSPVGSDVLNFKSINKKAVSYRKYRAKHTTDKGNIESKGTENKETSDLRTVRKIIKSSGDITVCLESKNFDESAMDAFGEAEDSLDTEEIVDELSNESSIQVLEDSTVESNFSDSLGGSNVISPQDASSETAELSKSKYKVKHRGHQRATTHSKHCIKRILSRSSKSAIKKESELDVIQLDNKSNESSESDRKFKDLSPADSKVSGSSRKITSPLRTGYSPVFSSDLSRMSVKRRSRSPTRRRSRSPVRRRHSTLRRGSRSPRRRSRSPRRHSRSPVRKRSRSPKRRSRSPARRGSRSPARRRSRSPVRRRSRSPLRRRSRSPIRRRSRSAGRRRSRSPLRRRSRSPVRKRSRSPAGQRSRSPKTFNRRKSRSPIRSRNSQRISTSPTRRAYASESYVPLSKHSSPLRRKFELGESSFKSDSRNSLYSGESNSKTGLHKEFTASSRSHYPQHIQHESERDLDPISDDEEPAYFNTLEGPRHLDEIKKLPEPTRSMVMQLLQKFSASKVTPKDPSFNELMQFVNSHNSEMSQPCTAVNQEGVSNMPTSGLALQRFLLSNLAGASGHQNPPPSHTIAHASPPFHSPHPSGVPFSPSRPNLHQSSFSQPAFPPSNVQLHGPVRHPLPPPIPQAQPPAFDNQPVHTQFHPPQYDRFRSPNEPPSFQPKTRSDGMFKDLKAAVNKLFGANEGNSNERVQLPPSHEFMAEQNQSQWGQDPRNSYHQFNPLGPKNVISGDREDSDFRNLSRGGIEPPNHSIVYQNKPNPYFSEERNLPQLHVPPPDAKVAFCDAPHTPIQKNLFPVVNSPKAVNDVKVSLAQRLAAVLVKVGMLDVPGALLQEMLMKIGAFSSCPPQDISEDKIIDILRRLGYLNRY